jgi:EAL domain-containing protein (putative c-di-GMP-specific phosphodiesterase class I)
VETAADLRTARAAGISLFQGWLLSGAHSAEYFDGTDVVLEG